MSGMSEESARKCFHVPVMAKAVLGLLNPRPGEVAVDVTLGGAGHAALMLKAVLPNGMLIGIDRDVKAIEEAAAVLSYAKDRVKFVRARMSKTADVLSGLGLKEADVILADIGVSSHQFDEFSRGFSFMRDGPLDMRMDQEEGPTARDLIIESDVSELARIIAVYGEERYATRIAKAIAGRTDLDTTAKLASAIERAIPRQRSRRIHPATRTFQALRIAVNDELGELAEFLRIAPDLLGPGGRLAILSYHSLEDRLVKRSFRALASSGGFDLLTKKALRPDDEEVNENPRARSAKLRAIRRAN